MVAASRKERTDEAILRMSEAVEGAPIILNAEAVPAIMAAASCIVDNPDTGPLLTVDSESS